jgi:hypothetical protein
MNGTFFNELSGTLENYTTRNYLDYLHQILADKPDGIYLKSNTNLFMNNVQLKLMANLLECSNNRGVLTAEIKDCVQVLQIIYGSQSEELIRISTCIIDQMLVFVQGSLVNLNNLKNLVEGYRTSKYNKCLIQRINTKIKRDTKSSKTHQMDLFFLGQSNEFKINFKDTIEPRVLSHQNTGANTARLPAVKRRREESPDNIPAKRTRTNIHFHYETTLTYTATTATNKRHQKENPTMIPPTTVPSLVPPASMTWPPYDSYLELRPEPLFNMNSFFGTMVNYGSGDATHVNALGDVDVEAFFNNEAETPMLKLLGHDPNQSLNPSQ